MSDSSNREEVAKDRSLYADRSFWGMTFTQFFGAFNDNVFKQLVLLLALPAVAQAGGSDQDMQGWATFIFSLPFVLFSGYCGYLSDRFSKTPIIVLSKVAEIVIMILGLLSFMFYDQFGMYGTWTVLFLMATQSTFFGPGKYGILPELFKEKDLAKANGLILMSTFLAIIFGVVIAGALYKRLQGEDGSSPASNLWIGSLFCIVIAVVGTISSMMVRRTPAAQPDLKLTADAIGVSLDIRQLLWRDRPLLIALLVSCVFWMVSSMALPTVNRLGKDMLKMDEETTSILVAMIAIGIMAGAPLGGLLCRRFKSGTLVTAGLCGIAVSLAYLGFFGGVSATGSRISLLLLGVWAAIYSIPLQVFLQERPPDALKGRMIATMNQANFAGMMLAGPCYQLFEGISKWQQWPICSVFLMIGLLVVPLALFYRLRTDAPMPDPQK